MERNSDQNPWWVLGGEDGRTPINLPPDERPRPADHNVENRQVGLTMLDGEHGVEGTVTISTVFLGLNHNLLRNGPAILFETMVFGGVMDDTQMRYETWAQAEAGHAEMVERVIDEEREAVYQYMLDGTKFPPKITPPLLANAQRKVKVNKEHEQPDIEAGNFVRRFHRRLLRNPD